MQDWKQLYVILLFMNSVIVRDVKRYLLFENIPKTLAITVRDFDYLRHFYFPKK